MTPQHRWPDGADPASAELRRALDEASLRGPDDMTLRRVWSEVAAPAEPPRARSGLWFAGGVASTAALAVVSAFWLWPHARELAPTRSVAVTKPVPSEVQAGPGERHLTLEGGVEATLGRASIMRLEDGAPRIEGGEVRFSVPHRQPGHPFVVRAEGYRVVVVGTRFGVSVDNQAVGVDVDEGIVEVWEASTQRRLARLTPGEDWHSPEPLESTAPDTTAAPSAGPAVRAIPGRRHAERYGASRTLALASPGEIGVGSDRESVSPEAAATASEAAAARAALAAGDATKALQLYRALAQGTGPSAENAAYEIGKVLNERMGQPASAITAWRRYRAANPDGILRVEADVSIIETLARLGDSDEALTEATEFLRRHPDSERRAEIARLAGDLYRTRGDCKHAVASYQITLGASRPHDAVEAAAFHRAACLVHMGDGGGADAARAYLRSYPNGRFRSDAQALANGGAAPRP
ncbi:MAG TPA: FecR domain-containing protein [Polyangia bacterium]|nr:FecR domain-containing protein [Polyangia bacterium]